MIRRLALTVSLSLLSCLDVTPDDPKKPDSGTPPVTITCLDNDGDGFGGTGDCSQEAAVDCDDNNAQVYPGADELCNGRDDNCNGQVDEGLPLFTYYEDADGDGYGDAVTGEGCGLPPAGSVLQDGDCDDTVAGINPGAAEACNNLDDDCDGTSDNNIAYRDFYPDLDGDGFGDALATPINSCLDTVAGQVTNNLDCDDTNPTIKPGAVELCDRIDNNCDGQVDNGIAYQDWYPDLDGDGFGDQTAAPESSCGAVAGKVLNNTDCDDSSSSVKPGAPEVCNGIDDNCNGLPDDGLSFNNYYTDLDNDGYGDIDAAPVAACTPPPNSSLYNTDCDDTTALINPGRAEVCNGIDDNCSGAADEGLPTQLFYVDADGDGFGAAGSMPQVSCLPMVSGWVLNQLDCNDSNFNVKPGATEVCNGVDDDCSGMADDGLTFITYYIDNDGDGYGRADGSTSACSPVANRVTQGGDCNDDNINIHPGRAEVCNGIDDNCVNGIDEGLPTQSYYRDGDGDGYGQMGATAIVSCGLAAFTCPVASCVTNNTDCNDSNASIRPGAAELCNGIDDNCNMQIDEDTVQVNWYLDNDEDGYGAASDTSPVLSCPAVAGRAPNNSDCNDNNSAIKPGATEVCDGVDNNCVNGIDEGNPGGGVSCSTGQPGRCSAGTTACLSGSVQCQSNQGPIAELCNGIDDDCNGQVDNGNPGGGTSCATGQLGRCSAGTTACLSGTVQCQANQGPIAELCNGIDDNCNGQTDEGNPGGGAACTTNLLGICAAGTQVCMGGNLNCQQTNLPTDELCNGLDDNCNGIADEPFTNKGQACSAGVGECLRNGTFVCNAAQTGTQCSVVPGPPTAPACDGLDNDCDGIVDEPEITLTNNIVNATAYQDIEVQPYYYSASCQGGALSSGSDALNGGALVMSVGSAGLAYQRLDAGGVPTGSTLSVFPYTYTDVDFAQAGDGYIVAGIWNSTAIDLAYVAVDGTKRVELEFAWDDSAAMDSLRVVRANGRKVTVLWRESGVGLKIAQVEACLISGSWSFRTPGCGSTTLTRSTISGTSAALSGIGADSNVVDWTATQTCQSNTATRKVGITYRTLNGTAGGIMRFFTIDDNGTGKSAETNALAFSGNVTFAESDVTFFKDASNVDQYFTAFVTNDTNEPDSVSDLNYWSTNYTGYHWVWDDLADENGGASLLRPRTSATATGIQAVAIRYIADASGFRQQVMTRNFDLNGIRVPAGDAVEIPVTSGACSGEPCRPGNKSGLTNWYHFGRLYYSGRDSTPAGTYSSTLTCN